MVHSMIETVRGNMEGFTLEEVNRARTARMTVAMMGHPSEDTVRRMVSANTILNCDINSSDLANARAIFGPDRAAIRGKTVRRQPDKVRREFVSIIS
ncbi:hypothetical protein ACHAWO_000483 [Cyclotella atomus]|uniref:Uncharacterized protein n=1 Tax=Cyclotella atomus TaxID=382360 RepID=A0ABD3PIY2_9STRA